MKDRRIVLLGPQRTEPTVGAVVRDLGISGPVATITAGWQEAEPEDAALQAELGGDTLPLRLYERAERVWDEDPELSAAHRAMQSDLRRLRELYNRRLASAADAWIELLQTRGPERLLGPERAAALEAIRALDAHHLARIREMRSEFEEGYAPLERTAVARQRAELKADLARVSSIVIEGGHAAVLHNRIALFGVETLLQNKTVLACSAGAMVISERVVLYNDAPPRGPGHAEVALPGFGLAPGVFVLPHARQRLKLDDAARMKRLADRLAPSRGALLEAGARLSWDGARWQGNLTLEVAGSGEVRPWENAA